MDKNEWYEYTIQGWAKIHSWVEMKNQKFLWLFFVTLIISFSLLASCSGRNPLEQTEVYENPSQAKPNPTPSSEYTPTKSSLTILPTPSATPQVKITNTDTFQSSDRPLGNPLMLEFLFGGEVFLQDISSGVVRPLNSEIIIVEDGFFLGWSSGGCSFYFRTQADDIVEVNLKGEIVSTVFSNKVVADRGEKLISAAVQLSSSFEWVATSIFSGNSTDIEGKGYRFDKETVVVMANQPNSQMFEISERGGGWIYQWSPDSLQIAYSDYDPAGEFQIFVSDPTGKQRMQITDYNDGRLPPDEMIWSPDGQYFILVYDVEGLGIELVNPQKGQVESLREVVIFGWKDDSSLILWLDHEIRWIDPANGSILRRSTQVPSPNYNIQRFGDSDQFGCLVGCFGHNEYLVIAYDIDREEFITYPNAQKLPDLVGGWSVAPRSFISEEFCP